jgi:hypothetical protein
MPTLFNLPKQVPLSSSGGLLAGAKLYFYSTGTSTPKNTYSDFALTTPNANPVVADGNGIFIPIYMLVDERYRVVLKTSADVLIYDVPDIGGPLMTQSEVGTILYPRTAAEISAGVTPTYYYYEPGDVRRQGAVGDGSTDDTTALQNAFDVRGPIYIRGGGKFMFTNLTARIRSHIYGDGPRKSVLRQKSSATGVAITFETGLPPASEGVNDITEGGYCFENWGLEVKGTTGLGIGGATLSSMFSSNNFRIQNQHSETLGSLPYTVPASSIGINLDGASSAVIFMSNHRNLEIRSFETAVKARSTVNEQFIHGWFVDCKFGFDVQEISTWHSYVTHESGVQNARCWLIDGAVSNVHAEGERWELTQSGCYGVEFGASSSLSNVHFKWPNVLIASDGSAWPGRKYTGTLPAGALFYVFVTTGPLIAGLSTTEFSHGFDLRIGGTSMGDGKLTIGRNSGGADCTLAHDGTHFYLKGGNSLRLVGDGGADSTYKVDVNSTGVGFQGTNAIAKPTVTGSRAGNAALASVLTALANYGLITDSSS